MTSTTLPRLPFPLSIHPSVHPPPLLCCPFYMLHPCISVSLSICFPLISHLISIDLSHIPLFYLLIAVSLSQAHKQHPSLPSCLSPHPCYFTLFLLLLPLFFLLLLCSLYLRLLPWCFQCYWRETCNFIGISTCTDTSLLILSPHCQVQVHLRFSLPWQAGCWN